MTNLIQEVEDLIEQLTAFEKSIQKLKTASVSRASQRQELKALHKTWLPLCGRLEQDQIVECGGIQQATQHWNKLLKLADTASPKASYKAVLKPLLGDMEKRAANLSEEPP